MIAIDNWLLAQLPEPAGSVLKRELDPVELELGQDLELPGEEITWVHFPIDCLISFVSRTGPRSEIEVGIVGREGMTAIPVILGNDRWPLRVFVQTGGPSLRVRSEVLRSVIAGHPELARICRSFVQGFIAQAAANTHANGVASIEQRLARWLLMATDRLRREELTLTHTFLSIMLAVRRASVTEALHVLEGRKLIRARRSRIAVLDRDGLRETAQHIYGSAELEYARLLGDFRSASLTRLEPSIAD